jgi:hypothetical protein
MSDHNQRESNVEIESEVTNKTSDRSEELKREALLFFGLDESSTDYDLEQKYWQKIKRYRSDPKANSESLDRINEAYEVASGNKQESEHSEAQRARSPKLFGRTMREWRVYFYYSWWKYVLVALLLFVSVLIVKQIFFTARTDFRVVAVGHFENYETKIEEFSKEHLGYKKPTMYLSNLVIDDSEPSDMMTMYGSLSAAANLSLENDVLITDSRTFPFYIMNFVPIDDLYESMLSELPEDKKARIKPVWFSTAEYYQLEYDYGVSDELEESSEEDRTRHIYGILIDDPELIRAMGFENRWINDPPSLVFCISQNAEDKERSWAFIREIVTEIDWFLVEDGISDSIS